MRNQRQRRKVKKNNFIYTILVVTILISGVSIFLSCNIFKGKYNKDNVMITEEIKLKISKENMFNFQFEMNLPENKIQGIAKKNGLNKAKYINKDVEIEFVKGLKGIEINKKGSNKTLGINSSINMSGKYINGIPKYKEQNRLTNIFYTEKMQNDVKALMKEEIKNLEDILLNGAAIEDIDYEMNAKVYEVSRTGSAKNAIIIADEQENFYMGYFNGEVFKYLTNREDYKNAVPKLIETYMERKGYSL